jgi:hypothetical protein
LIAVATVPAAQSAGSAAKAVAVAAFPVTLPAIALVTSMSVAQSFANLVPVNPIVCGVDWSVNTAPDNDVKYPALA